MGRAPLPKSSTSRTPSPLKFIVIVNPETYQKWRVENDRTIPLADVVGSFHIYKSGQGNQGIMGQVSKQELDAVFGTTNLDDAIVKVLETGHVQHGSIRDHTKSSRNSS